MPTNTGICIGGPIDGHTISGVTKTMHVPVLVRYVPPNEYGQTAEFDHAIYKFSDGAWRY